MIQEVVDEHHEDLLVLVDPTCAIASSLTIVMTSNVGEIDRERVTDD
jgi:hypothetical protein